MTASASIRPSAGASRYVPAAKSAPNLDAAALVLRRREELNLTQSEVARRLRLDPSIISHWEKGTRRIPPIRRPALASVLNISPNLLYSDTDLESERGFDPGYGPDDQRDDPLTQNPSALSPGEPPKRTQPGSAQAHPCATPSDSDSDSPSLGLKQLSSPCLELCQCKRYQCMSCKRYVTERELPHECAERRTTTSGYVSDAALSRTTMYVS